MKLSTLILALSICLLGGWGITATYIFAPDVYAMLDVSDMLSGLALSAMAIGGNLTAFKIF